MASQSIENMLMNQPLHIANHIAANRIVIQPMEGCDGTPEGGISSLTKRRYLRFAQSGAGIIWFEAVAVCAEGRANPAQLYLTEENVAEFHQLIREIKEMALHQFGFEPIVILQATHSGRYSKPTGAPRPIVAYRRAVYEEGKETQDFEVATEKYCDKLPEYFAKTAKLAAEAGFDGIDVKCCHGYLLNEFLSAFDRPGQYGGTLENRCRLYFACVDAVKENVSAHMFVTTRLNAYDGFDYLAGFGVNEKNEIDLRETKWILKQLQKKGVELVNITIGNPYLKPQINRPYLGGDEDGMIGVRRVVTITGELQQAFPEMKLVASALSFPGTQALAFAESVLEQSAASLVGFGRMAFAYPLFYQDFLKQGGLEAEKVCIKCGNCSRMMRAGTVAGCPVRDKALYGPIFKEGVKGESK